MNFLTYIIKTDLRKIDIKFTSCINFYFNFSIYNLKILFIMLLKYQNINNF